MTTSKTPYNNLVQYEANLGIPFVVYPFPILNTLVPQLGHAPWVAGLPFFILIDFAFLISTFLRHFIQ
jgi:hypothetical protein